MDPWRPLFENLTRLKDSWPVHTAPVWTWDGRFSTIASSFGVELEPEVRTSAVHAFPRGWTAKSIDTAPAALQALAKRTGLRAGQRLLAGDELSAASLFGLWWPWGTGTTITLRIGIAAPDATDPLARLRELFGVRLN